MDELIMLGTGHAMVYDYYNTCFCIKEQYEYILVDTGGGSGILKQLKKSNIDIYDIHHIIITHCHTDHILGIPWIIRMIDGAMGKGIYQGNLIFIVIMKQVRL